MTRIHQDNYPTPAWCVRRLFEVFKPELEMLDPCAGEGSILKVAKEHGLHTKALEIRPECHKPLSKVANNFRIADALETNTLWQDSDLVITNPPYSKAQEFIERAIEHAKHVAMLLRINYAASEERASFMRRTRPNMLVLPNRPSFAKCVSCKYCKWKQMLQISEPTPTACPICQQRTRTTKSDSTEYAWFVWSPYTVGQYITLASTPKHERL